MYFQGNSRLGAKVKADKVTGQIELALGTGGDGGDTAVATRRAYGVWKWSDNGGLKVGKDYSPVTDFISNQWFDADNDLLGTGNFYGRRPAGVTLILGGFELAALVPSYGADLNTTANGINGATGNTDPDSYIPRFEAQLRPEARRGLHQALRRLPVLHGQAGRLHHRDRRRRRVVLARWASAPAGTSAPSRSAAS